MSRKQFLSLSEFVRFWVFVPIPEPQEYVFSILIENYKKIKCKSKSCVLETGRYKGKSNLKKIVLHQKIESEAPGL